MSDANDARMSHLGGSVGGRIARLVADASAATRAKSAPAYTRSANSVIDHWFRLMDREAREALEPILGQLLADPDTPVKLKPLLSALARPNGQWQALAALGLVGSAVAPSLGELFANLLSPVVQLAIRSDPNSLLPLDAIASALARNVRWSRTPREEAERQGLTFDRLEVLRELAVARVPLGELLALINRGHLSVADAVTELRAAGVTRDHIGALITLRHLDLTPEQLNEMVNRDIVSVEEGAKIAARSGMSRDDFAKLTELGGVPLAPQELGEAFRRGFIDSARFRRGIVQGPLRNEWFDVLEKLQFVRMSPVEAADAVNQGKLGEDEGRRIAHEHGLDPDDFSIILQTAGIPPGVATMQEAWNRGIVDEQEFTDAFLESNIKNRHIRVLKEMRFRTMPREQINFTYRFGGFTREEALLRYKWDGWSRADAEAMMRVEEVRQLGAERELTIATVRELYEAHAISRDDAIDFYRSIGFSDDNAALLIAIADIRRRRRRDNLAISRVRARFVGHKIDKREAENALDRIGVIAAERDDLIDTWEIEREINIPQLTTSQIQQAVRRGLISSDVAFIKLRENGYAEDDATVLVSLAVPAVTGG